MVRGVLYSSVTMATVSIETMWPPVIGNPLSAITFRATHSLHTVALLSFLLLPASTQGIFLQFLPRVISDRGDSPALGIHVPSSSAIQNTLSWGVKLRTNCHRKASNNRTRLDLIADDIGTRASLINHGQVGELCGHYLYKHKLFTEALNGTLDPLTVGEIQEETEALLQQDPSIEWVHRQWIRSRTKRALSFDDPMYPQQWHLHNSKTPGMDINVTEIWSHNITGEGIVVAVIDDGLEWTNPDIRDNYSPEGSCDLNSGDDDPMPEVHTTGKTENRHGTRCAGEIAAVANEKCGVGVAYGAKVAGIRLLDGPMTDSLEATAFNKHMQINDIYSCSWGPDDDGKTVDGPHPLALAALQHGVTSGRRGRGSIFVVASGNGGRNHDNCNFDGYANSMYTITIGALNEKGMMPYYAEECAALLGVTFSSGSGGNSGQRNIVTTDWTLGQSNKGCTKQHTGTSAAAPLAAGLIALSLQAKPCLSWRDVQHLIVYSSTKVDMDHGDWSENGAGFLHSHKHGFGAIKAWQLVNAAKVWKSVPWLTSLSSFRISVYKTIPANNSPLVLHYKVSNSSAQDKEVSTLEHVLVSVSLTHPYRGQLRMELLSPSGTLSHLATTRNKDRSNDGLKSWTFSTVRCWGEQPSGDWTLKVYDTGTDGGGVFQEWQLVLYGSLMSPEEVQQRKETVEDALSGEYLDMNLTEPCSFYWNPSISGEELITTKTMRMLLLGSALITILAAYYTLEQAFCNQEDKDAYLEEYIDAERHRLKHSKCRELLLTETSFGATTNSEEDQNSNIPNSRELYIETDQSEPLTVTVDISPQNSTSTHAMRRHHHHIEGALVSETSSDEEHSDSSISTVCDHGHSNSESGDGESPSNSKCPLLQTSDILSFISTPQQENCPVGEADLLLDLSAINSSNNSVVCNEDDDGNGVGVQQDGGVPELEPFLRNDTY